MSDVIHPTGNNSPESVTKVFIVNRSCHNFAPAKRFGTLVFLTTGLINRYAVSEIYREFEKALADSNPNDYILVSGMNTMIAVICGLFAAKHQRLNLLLYKNGRYLERTVMLGESK